jgi:uncharacterized phage protein (TIGR01671 family)
MREIKVRAWYKPYKQMCQVESLRNGVYTAVLIEEPFYDRRLVEADEIVIEQFTGLKDKNGTEIYQGDIIFQKPLGSNKPGLRGKITYKEDHAAFMFEVYEREKVVMYLFLSEFSPEKTCEVVGNIHEDSELLEEK